MAQLQDFAVTSLEEAERALSELRAAKKEMDEYAPLLKRNVSIIKDLEGTQGLNEQVVMIWEPCITQAEGLCDGMDRVIAQVQKLVNYFQEVDSLNKKNALASAFGD